MNVRVLVVATLVGLAATPLVGPIYAAVCAGFIVVMATADGRDD